MVWECTLATISIHDNKHFPKRAKAPGQIGVVSCLAMNSTDRLGQCKCNPMHFVTSSISHKRYHENEATISTKETCSIDITRKQFGSAIREHVFWMVFAEAVCPSDRNPRATHDLWSPQDDHLIFDKIFTKYVRNSIETIIYSINFRSLIQLKSTDVKVKTSQYSLDFIGCLGLWPARSVSRWKHLTIILHCRSFWNALNQFAGFPMYIIIIIILDNIIS